MSTHTPGPWKWVESTEREEGGLIGAHREPVVWGVWCNNSTAYAEPTSPANGCLIAAAPRLLASLKAVVSRPSVSLLKPEQTPWLAEAKAAIAEADPSWPWPWKESK